MGCSWPNFGCARLKLFNQILSVTYQCDIIYDFRCINTPFKETTSYAKHEKDHEVFYSGNKRQIICIFDGLVVCQCPCQG